MFAELSKRFPIKNRHFRLLGHPNCLLHDPGKMHPESIPRLEAILRGLLQLDAQLPLDVEIPAPAKLMDLNIVHAKNYLLYLEEACLKSESHFMSRDNPLSEFSLDAILASGGMSLAAAKHLVNGGSCFCLTRPPGHHAGKENSEGFCFINHVALAIENIRLSQPMARFLIVDFDVHHGNGIDSIYREDDKVFYFSLHGTPAHVYPGTGWEQDTGGIENPESRLNIALDLHTSGEGWIKKFREHLAVAAEKSHPDFLLISAGFDAHIQDPFGLMDLQDEHYSQCIQLLLQASHQYCQDRMGLFLEGGYSMDVLSRVVPKVIAQLAVELN